MKNLLGKALLGLITLLVVLGSLLFLAAWTVKYFQGWIYLFVFAVSVLLITVYLFKRDTKLLERRLAAGPTAEKETSQKLIQSLAQLSFCSVYVIAGLDYRFGWSSVPLYLSLLADACVGLGFYVVFLVFKENSYTSAVIEVNADQKVISTGPYSLVRHPMYSGASLMMFFSPIALGSYWSELSTLLLIYFIILRLLDEERFLAKNLKGYQEYCQQVRYHLIPFLW